MTAKLPDDERIRRQRERTLAWRRGHRAMWLAMRKRHRDSHVAEHTHALALLRARGFNAPGSHTLDGWREKVALLGGCCLYCGRSNVLLGRDHKVPLALGGSDDIANIVPACRRCNSEKRNKTAREYLTWKAAAA